MTSLLRRFSVVALVCFSLSAAACVCRLAVSTATPEQGTATAAPTYSDPCASVQAFAAMSVEASPQVRQLIEGAPEGNIIPPSYRAEVARITRNYLDRCGTSKTLALARELISFPTVSARSSPADGVAFVGLAEHLERWSRAAGLRFAKIGENDVWEVALGAKGASQRQLGFVMHADVVPEAEDSATNVPADVQEAPGMSPANPPGWTYPPFQGTVHDGRLYGRGSEDDKGPIASVLTVLAALKESGLVPPNEILAILGTGEESDWDGMERYVGSQSLPRYSISVDASFPVVVAESGFVAWRLKVPREGKASSTNSPSVEYVKGGAFLTQVPGDASMVVKPGAKETAEALLARAQKAVASTVALLGTGFGATAELQDEDGNKSVRIAATGIAVHSSTADEGANALWVLAGVAKELGVTDNGAGIMLKVLQDSFVGDHFGEKLKLAYQDPLMGKLVVAPTMLHQDDDSVILEVNMRRPRGEDSASFAQKLDAKRVELSKQWGVSFEEAKPKYVGEPHVAATEGPLANTLLEIYRRNTGDNNATPTSIRGGTYARLFPGAVSFGPSFPNAPYRGHAPDEYIEVEALRKLTLMLFDATMALGWEDTSQAADNSQPKNKSP